MSADLDQRCPHTTVRGVTRRQCSMCLGAKPKAVSRDDATGMITVDGVPLRTRKFQPPATGHAPRVRTGKRSKWEDDDDDK